ncbi:hypothetical protein [Brasilonema bromeliae]|uniref:Uncharacterized protein n=1 Tax=Brasilonema bromeliae SPC951 TaxID=385972 RepID=A0ABX1P8V1_9CYAN|nr:hypothetical protein [Brasilonema bromeliae]NMG20351.1 hypothetical protein [Brasilonema bromeliae SPC951]
MKLSSENFIAPILVAFITAAATVGAAIIGQNNKTPSAVNPSATPSSIISKNSELECNKTVVTKPCIANVTMQINSDEPRQIKNNERVPLKARDTLRLANLRYCIPPEVTLNKVEVKAYLFPKGTENYKNGLLTSSSFPTYTGCHNIGNFEPTWKVESGQHQVTIPIVKYDGGSRIVDKSFYLNLDVGQ